MYGRITALARYSLDEMPALIAWHCARCQTLNLPNAEACRRCGAAPGETGRRAKRERLASRDNAGLAAVLSLFLPGLGQLYTGRRARALKIVALPVAIGAIIAALVLVVGPLTALAPRVAVGVAAGAVALLALCHVFVVLDAFGAPSTPGAGLRGKRRAEYATLGTTLVVLALLYVTLFRQASAWAALTARVFEPFQTSGGAQGALWSGQERLNVLLLGIDTRPGHEAEGQNTDTIIVFTVDPVNRSAGMLSIPRDTLVTIPGHGEDKINAAFAFGGPDLARKTVSQLVGVPIHSYALVDFRGFSRIVHAVGGVLVDAPLPVRDEAYPTEDFGVTRLDLRAGPQQMAGETALRYSRSRHDSNDFSRAERQQRVIAALTRHAREHATLLELPALVDELADAVRTDLDPGSALPLLRLGLAIDTKDIDRRVLRSPSGDEPGQLREINSAGGYYLLPIKSALSALVAELFYDPRVRAEAATVELRAPSTKATLAHELRDDLERRHYRVARVASGGGGSHTTVIVRNGAKRYSAEQLAKTLGATVTRGNVDSDADIVAVLGDDFRGLAAER